MESYTLKKPDSVKSRKRVGRGMSSGCGKTSSRGMNGQMCRSGSTHRAWFEGGQLPLMRRIPKRGFNNSNFTTNYQLVNLERLNKLSETDITPELLESKGLIRDKDQLIKILGKGNCDKSFTVLADAFSETVKEKIEKAGGKISVR
ncbi:MAG: 50S ribosomal protein L15 [Spirochaetes bacterium]|jgi:large subunit ribosomal protein L15|nr:50S ribosomal protein L15 [Spirochaetota bacterium]